MAAAERKPVLSGKRSKLAALVVASVLSLFAAVNFWFLATTSDRIVAAENLAGPPRVGILLGCEPVLRNGRTNEHFQRRVIAAADLLRRGQISRLTISGHPDNHGYDEPQEMKMALVGLGISPDKLSLHEDGRRTFDTLRWAAKRPSGPVVLVSDRSHLPRALALARSVGMDAIGVAAQASPMTLHEASVRLRETLARCRAVWDLLADE